MFILEVEFIVGSMRRIENPLTIIAIFAGITEVAASSALPFLTNSVQAVFVWFLILFPFVLIVAFFGTLNFNPKVLYAPGDYRDEEHFLRALQISAQAPEITVTGPDAAVQQLTDVVESAATADPKSPFFGLSRRELDAANSFNTKFHPLGQKLFNDKAVKSYSFGIHGEGLFVFSAVVRLKRKGADTVPENFILRVKEQPEGAVELSVVGKDFKTTDPNELAQYVFQAIEATASAEAARRSRSSVTAGRSPGT